MRRTLVACGGVLIAALLAIPAAAHAVGAASLSEVPASVGPPQSTHLDAANYADAHPGSAPAGTNDFSCRPSAAHPNPVILAHGSDANAYSDWSEIAPRLKDRGYCVFALNYGGKPGARSFGTEDMYLSAGQVSEFTHRVLEATGAAKVDLVGYSQGATVTRYFVNRLGGSAVVDRWIGVASPSYGGVFYGLVPLVQSVPGGADAAGLVTTTAVAQQMQGSDFLNELNAGSDTVPGVQYVTIGTRFDEMIQPFSNVALHGPGAENILVQDRCPQDMTGHMNMVYDPFAVSLVVGAVDPSSPVAPCQSVPLGTGMAGMIGR
ncbi:esterase/lipase family protein [Rhodococcus sp. NPDC059234]|uniref:esterase/lipase family protein n=1 Tax=Rhodococcus sp. NPDC059234 TaxID=3346781 RepID=UPI00366D4339